MPLQHMTIKPPLGGMVESTGLEEQPAGTCAYAMNCWPSDAEQRARLSARPAIKAYATGGTTLPNAEPVRMLAEVNYATAKETTRYLVASAGGRVYKLSTASGGWTEITSALRLSGANPLQAAPFGNKLFIADWEATSATNSGSTGVLGEHESSGTAGATMPGFVSGFGSAGDSWTEATTAGEYGYDLSTHPVEALGTLLSGKSGVRFGGVGAYVGALSRTGIALPPDGESATWYAKVGPWEGDARIVGGIGSGGTGVPGEYALVYDADIDRVYAYIGGSIVTLGSGLTYATVSGKKYCLFKIKLTNSSGTITAEMTINDLADDSELLSHTATRAYTSSTLSSQIISDEDSTTIFADEVGYNAGTGTTEGQPAGTSGSITDSSVSEWSLGEGVSNYVLVVTSKQDGTVAAGAGVYEILATDGDILHLKGGDGMSWESALRWHLIKVSSGASRNTFVIPLNAGWSASQADNHFLRITGTKDGDNAVGFWEVTSAETDKLTVQVTTEQLEQPGTIGGVRDQMWCLPRTAKVLDLEANSLTRWVPTATKGNVPHGSKMIATWQDRMVLGNDQVSPHVWHMSRNGSPYDFLYGAEDLGSPVAGTTFQAGIIGEPLTAVISHNKSCLLIGCQDSLWVMRGDPMRGGYIERLTDDVGVLGPWSHPKTDKAATFFLSHLGLFGMPSGCGEIPQIVSEGRLPKTGPKFWRETDQLGFDGVNNGLILATSYAATATQTNLWYDFGSGGWWPFSLDAGTGRLKEITALFSWQPAAGRSSTTERSHQGSLMIGCHNGNVCRFDESSSTDEGGSVITATAHIGPINFSLSPSLSAMVQEIKGIGNYGTGVSSTQTLYVASTASEALSLATAGTYGYEMTWGDTYNAVTDNPRMSGHSLVLVVSATGDDWAFESAGLTVSPLGRSR